MFKNTMLNSLFRKYLLVLKVVGISDIVTGSYLDDLGFSACFGRSFGGENKNNPT